MIQIVIFSFNRAMQLDFMLQSILKRFKYPSFKIAIIYHTTGVHDKGYEKLIEKYKDNEGIKFYERKKQILRTKLFYNFDNFKLLIKHFFLFKRSLDNFKPLLESVLKTSDCEFVIFNTDDAYAFVNIEIPDEALNLIRKHPMDTTYRMYVGDNLVEFPDFPVKIDNLYYKWSYYEHNRLSHWTFPFAVDATVYHTQSILKILKKVFYHNPITLENHACRFVKRNHLFSIGLSPIKSEFICTKLNRVSTISENPTIHIDPDLLNQKYIEGYELELNLPKDIINTSIVPLIVTFAKGNTKEIVYELDEEGRKVQQNLSL